MFLGLIGVGIIIVLPVLSEIDGASMLGNLAVFAGVIVFTIFGLLSKKYQNQYQFSTQAITLSFIVVTALLSLPFAFAEVLGSASTIDSVPIEWRHWVSIVFIGTLATTLVYLMHQKVIHKANELAASLFHFIQPVVVPIMAVILLSEKISIELVIGGILAVVGAWLASQRDKKT